MKPIFASSHSQNHAFTIASCHQFQQLTMRLLLIFSLNDLINCNSVMVLLISDGDRMSKVQIANIRDVCMCAACSVWIIESVQLSSHNRSCTFSTLQRSHCLPSLFIVLENYHQTFVTKLQLFVAPIILFCHPCLCQISNDTTNTLPVDNNSNNTFPNR